MVNIFNIKFKLTNYNAFLMILLLQDPIVKPISELDTTSLQDLVPEIPLWLKNPDYDRVSISKTIFLIL